MFSKEAGTLSRTDARTSADTESSEAMALSVIAAGMRIVGDVESVGLIKVDGRIEGSVTSARQVLLSRGASIKGSIVADDVVVAGSVDGGIRAGDRLELQSTSIVAGDIDTRSIIVLEGAQINGSLRMAGVTASSDPQKTQMEPLRIVPSPEPNIRAAK